MKKIILYSLLVIVIAVTALISYVKLALPDVGDPEDLKIEYTAERVERGKYLANAVAVCMDCHSTRDWNTFAAPLKEGTLGKGGEEFTQEFGFPGHYYAKNIRPYGVGKWTDGEILEPLLAVSVKTEKLFFL